MTYILIVTGQPASGKTTLGRRLAADLGIPFLSKDAIKETLYDSLGWTDKAHSRQLGIASFEVLYVVLESLLAAGVPAAIEAPFDPTLAAEKLSQLRRRYPFTAVQVLCWADGDVLIQRYRSRNESGERHPGHVDTDAMPAVEAQLSRGTWQPVGIPGPVIEVDTTEVEAIRYEALLLQVRQAIRQF